MINCQTIIVKTNFNSDRACHKLSCLFVTDCQTVCSCLISTGFVDPHLLAVDVAARAGRGRHSSVVRWDHHADAITLRFALSERHVVGCDAAGFARAFVVVTASLAQHASDARPAHSVGVATSNVADGDAL